MLLICFGLIIILFLLRQYAKSLRRCKNLLFCIEPGEAESHSSLFLCPQRPVHPGSAVRASTNRNLKSLIQFVRHFRRRIIPQIQRNYRCTIRRGEVTIDPNSWNEADTLIKFLRQLLLSSPYGVDPCLTYPSKRCVQPGKTVTVQRSRLQQRRKYFRLTTIKGTDSAAALLPGL